MRNIAGSVTLDELLAERQTIAEQIEKIVDQATTTWGVDVTAVELNELLKRTVPYAGLSFLIVEVTTGTSLRVLLQILLRI